MPVITLRRGRFCSLLGREMSNEELEEWLPWIGLDIEDTGPDYVKVEYNPNRMDFSSPVGIARALRGLLGLEVGLPRYEVREGPVEIIVGRRVAEVRPYVVGAVVRGLELDEEAIQEIIEAQEDLHWGIGRGRRKMAIGLHDLGPVETPIYYEAVGPTSKRFVPLDGREEMTLAEVLEKHEKGRAYGHLVAGSPFYPVIMDALGRVMSFPPVINSELTRIGPWTRELFIDITGPDLKALRSALRILTTTLADMGGRVEAVRVRYPDGTVLETPDLRPREAVLRVDYANELIGLSLGQEEVADCLRRCRLDAEPIGEGLLKVLIPPYRVDIMHEVDLVEEVAVGYGYFRLEPRRPPSPKSGQPHPLSELAGRIRLIMVGLGFTEVMNFVLTNERVHYELMRLPPGEAVRLANPVSAEYSMLREMLLPSLMANLASNVKERYPQRLFEVGDVVVRAEGAETRAERRLHLAAVVAHSRANYAEVKGYLDALMRGLGLAAWDVREVEHPSFLQGRVAELLLSGEAVGLVGEIHPEVLTAFGLENPVAAFELDLTPLTRDTDNLK
ncbi:phenylalanine--tRNA ligase subunit beta [Candidatus Bathyarchaeota archaeon]|nr:MAG: phenylalanine--tRNA ligase subunit beta [Candidatus Bathyarchaeota archaeon]